MSRLALKPLENIFETSNAWQKQMTKLLQANCGWLETGLIGEPVRYKTVDAMKR
ncbi:hypothetical protein [Nitrosomonas aestuarii]|uniref:hypothetical protein n=1 Tax=Nitrosomonas aestuarii TaxID=52441 RepID=UPI000D42C9F1|nr:hypothetical protein [Nitrosomonas aestuarii]PTN12288.1 hypothetical protein C8R11_10472 [Nitrosomonas aestuarii]